MSTESKCISCGGKLRFDIQSQGSKCYQFGNVIDILNNTKLKTKLDYYKKDNKRNLVNISTYVCENCGKTTIIKSDKQEIRCSSCSSPHLKVKTNILFEPDGIIPFSLTQEQTSNLFNKWLHKKWFVPSNFKSNQFKHNFSSFYLPTYNYDVLSFSTYSGVGIRKTESDGETHILKSPFSGTKETNYNKLLSSANKDLSSAILRKCGNFSFNGLKAYSMEFMYGLQTLEVNVGLEESTTKKLKDIEGFIRNDIQKSYYFDEIRDFVCKTTHNMVLYNYIYVPLWTNNLEYKNKPYNFLINGTTGKIM